MKSSESSDHHYLPLALAPTQDSKKTSPGLSLDTVMISALESLVSIITCKTVCMTLCFFLHAMPINASLTTCYNKLSWHCQRPVSFERPTAWGFFRPPSDETHPWQCFRALALRVITAGRIDSNWSTTPQDTGATSHPMMRHLASVSGRNDVRDFWSQIDVHVPVAPWPECMFLTF